MTGVTAKLLLLIAVLLMPLGMAPAAAVGAHPAMMMDTKGYCPDQGSHHDTKGGIAECTMACAAALPATDVAAHEPLLILCEPMLAASTERLHGLHPDTATPPPKHS